MAAVEPSHLDHPTFQSLACSYAALLLHDIGKDLSVSVTQAANLQAVLTAASAKVDKSFSGQMATALKHGNVGSIISGAASAPVAAAPVAATTATPAAAEKKKEAKKEEKKVEEEEDVAGGAMDLFGGGDDEW